MITTVNILYTILSIVSFLFSLEDNLGWTSNEFAFALVTICVGTFFQSIHLSIYLYFYEKYVWYWNLCLTIKNQALNSETNVALDKQGTIDITYDKLQEVRQTQEGTLVFIHWNSLQISFMEGFYGLIFLSLMIYFLSSSKMDTNETNINHFYNWFNEDFYGFLHCIQSNCLYAILIVIFVISASFVLYLCCIF